MNKKILISSIIILFMLIFNFNITYASSIGDVFTGANNFMNSATGNSVNEDDLKDVSDTVYKILMVLGISIAVIVSVVLGIQFMMGAAEEKAQIKEKLIPFLIGCVVIFGAFSIWRIVVNIGNQL